MNTGDDDSITSPSWPKAPSSTSSDSSLSDSLQDQVNALVETVLANQQTSVDNAATAGSSKTTTVEVPPKGTTSGGPLSAKETLARLRNFVGSRIPSSDSEASQAHNDKVGPEATKIKQLTDMVKKHALDAGLLDTLQDDSNLSSELFDALNQLQKLTVSDFTGQMLKEFEDLLFPLHRHVENIRDCEQQLDAKKAYVDENLGKVARTTEELSETLNEVDNTSQQLEKQEKRAAEIRAQMSALQQELDQNSVRQAELKGILLPAQAKADKLAATALDASAAISTAETKVEHLKTKLQDLSVERGNLYMRLGAFKADTT